ncbi:MAG: GntR domain protein [Lachnospiraceae bacterium]|jgi:DNA-binding FadR family transcriptional regulator|nr:GntR domain protein [Lachnospiraceae bacterium]
MYKFENFHNKPLTERVEDNILSYIVDNHLKIGAKLPNEYELAQVLGVSRSTIREAIKILASKNVLEVRRGLGTFVVNTRIMYNENDPFGLNIVEDRHKLVLDLLNVRLMIEPEIAFLAAQNATPEEVIELYERCEEVEKLIKDNVDHTPTDIEFHTCIARCSKNMAVEHLIPMINSSVAVLVNITHFQLKQETIQTHKAIADAIAIKDGVGAKCAMYMHLTYNRQLILDIINQNEKL